MRRYRTRRRAAGLHPVTRSEQQVPFTTGGLDHKILEARGLAMHCLVARKVARDPALLDKARRTLKSWRSQYGKDSPRALDEWHAILDRPWQEVVALIVDPGERATRLRQSGPVASLLGARQRERVDAAFRP